MNEDLGKQAEVVLRLTGLILGDPPVSATGTALLFAVRTYMHV